MPPKTTTKAAAEKLSDKPVEKPAEKPPADQVKDTSPVTLPPDATLEAAAKQLAAEAPPATILLPDSPLAWVGIDSAKPGSETTALVDIELVQDEGEPKIRIRALYPVTHNGTTYGPGLPAGDELDVTPEDRDRLVGLGVIEEEGDEV